MSNFYLSTFSWPQFIKKYSPSQILPHTVVYLSIVYLSSIMLNRSNWIDGDGHTGIVFMASSYSTSQSPSQVSVIRTVAMVISLSLTQREDTTDAPYLMGCKEDEFHNTSTFNTLERSAIHSYQQSDSYNPPQDNNTDKPHRAHYAELDLAPSSKYVPVSTNSVHYAQVDKHSFKHKRSLSPPHSKAVPVPVETPTAAAAKKHYDNPTYEMSSSYHYPVTPGDTVVWSLLLSILLYIWRTDTVISNY